MPEIKLKPCPFCGSATRMFMRGENTYFRRIECKCTGCNMIFVHVQDFAVSRIARVAINDSFEDTWNRRVNDVEN